MAINFSPKVGEIQECNFGNYPVIQNGQFSTTYYDGRIPPEMIKNRLVVVLNGKINGLQFFDQQIRWAKADLVQQVSRNRLNRARTYRGYLNQCLPHELVADIQRAVIKSINAISLIN